MRKLKTLFALLVLSFFTIGNLWATDVTYTLTIDKDDFNSTSYAANNNEKTSDAVCTTDNTKTYEVAWTSNQVMLNGSAMQWQKNNGYIYNSTDLGTINSVTVNSTDGSFTTYYGTSEHPTSGTTVGNGYFTVKVGNATGKTSSVVISFTISESSKTNVTDEQLSWSAASATVTFGETPYSLPSLTNTIPVSVTYESTDETVATISNVGEVSILKAGSTTIKAIYAGSETLNAKTVSYTLTVNKAPLPPITGGVTDVLNSSWTGKSTSSYSSLDKDAPTSDAHYKGVCAGQNSTVQLRTSGNEEGIVSSVSGGTVKRITVAWNSSTADGRSIDIYGSNTAYTAASELHGATPKGTKLGSIAKGETDLDYTEWTGDYKYIGIRSNDGALFLDEIDIIWIPATYTITFNANGGTGSMDAIENIAKNASKTLPANTFERTGYTFQGWATSAQGAKVYNNEATISSITADINLYAVWEANTTLITLNGNGEGASDGAAQIDYDDTALDDITHASWAAHELQGYFTAATEGTKIINANGTLVSDVANYTSNEGKWIYTADDELELFAQWTAITNYSVSTNLTGCTANAGNPEEFAAASASVTLNFDLADAERTWTGATISVTMGGNAVDPSDYDFDDGELTIMPTGGFTGNIAVTITAPEIKYDVIIGVNNNTYGAAKLVVNEEELDAVSVPKSATTSIKATANAGYRFVNWTSDENVTFGNATAASTTVSAVSEDAAIIANFEVIPAATLTLSENGSSHNLAGAHLQGDVVTLPTAVQEGNGVAGKVLVGWTDEANKEYAHDTDAPSVFYGKGTNFTLANTTQTLYAVYAIETGGGTSWNLATSVAANDVVVISTNAEYDGDMKTAGSISSQLMSCLSSTYNDDNSKITALAEGTLQFTIGGNSTDGWTLKNGNNYLVATAVKKMALQADEATWSSIEFSNDTAILTFSDAYGSLQYNYNSGSDRFTTYTSTQTAIALYKKVSIPATRTKYATTGAKAPQATPASTSVEIEGTALANGSIAVEYANVALANVKVATFENAACTDTLDAGWLTAALTNETKQLTFSAEVAASYVNTRSAYIQLVAPSPTINVNADTVVITVTQAANPSRTFASFDALVASDLPRTTTGTAVIVSFSNVQIQSISGKSVYLKINDAVNTSEYVQIYNKDGEAPDGWAPDGYLSTTTSISGTWKYYSPAMELYVELGTSWTGLSYSKDATGFDNIESDVNAVKVLKDGQIYILRGEKVYTIQGQLVK